MEKNPSLQFVAAVALWLDIVYTQGAAHGALLAQAMVDQGMTKEQLGAVDKALEWLERAWWIVPGPRRPLPIQTDVGLFNPDALWTREWSAGRTAGAPKEALAFIKSVQRALPPAAESDTFKDLRALAHFDRQAHQVRLDVLQGRTPNTPALVAAAHGWADRVVKSRGRTRPGKDLDMGANLDPAQDPGKDGGK